MKGIVFNIEGYAVHDGPGIRTLVFLKGCPLRCIWCCNPESQEQSPELLFDRDKCADCRACVKVCPYGANRVTKDGRVVLERVLCRACGRCVDVCPQGARSIMGRVMTADEVISEVEKDSPFYRRSGGGVTFSGGEPLYQLEFLRALLLQCKEKFIHTAIETTALAPWERIEQVLPLVDLWMMDIKHMDADRHRELCGVSNELILENAVRISNRKKPMRIRIPVIPGLNDEAENINKMADFISKLESVTAVDLLPYHRLGVVKYRRLGRTYDLKQLEPPEEERMEEIKGVFTARGLSATIGGLD